MATGCFTALPQVQTNSNRFVHPEDHTREKNVDGNAVSLCWRCVLAIDSDAGVCTVGGLRAITTAGGLGCS